MKLGESTAPLFRPRTAHQGDLIDMTAMVDIVFFLLIFFLVTSMQSLQSVIGLPTPEGPAAASVAPKVDDLIKDEAYATVTIYEDDTVWVEDEQTYGEQDLRVRLRDLRKGNKLLTSLLVVGDSQANHGTFVTVLDAAADAGFEQLKFSVLDSDEMSNLATY